MKSNQREEINKRQKEFYDFKKKNNVTKIWSYFRNGILNKTRKDIGVEKQILDLHVNWLGAISNKKILDLGCYAGNSLSMYLAENAKEYIALDLSEKGINILSERLKKFPNAKAIMGDFLSSDFEEDNFDIIYAYGVLHHFRDIHELIETLKRKIKPEGKIISYDPLETSVPLKIIRTIYRPFQSDKEWEWPFSKNTYKVFSKSFDIQERRAILGKAKWFFLLRFIPLGVNRKNAILKQWHHEDWKKSKESDSYMFKCMHLTMLMVNKS